MDTLISNVTVVTMNPKMDVLFGAYIGIEDGKIERFHNPKFPEQYIEMLDSVLHQKEELFALMKGTI